MTFYEIYYSPSRLLSLLTLIFLALYITSCEKNDLRWNIERNGIFDSKQNTKKQRCGYYNCENINGFSFNASGSSSTIGWQISNGYQGNGFVTNNSTGGSVEFNIQFDKDIVMSFWTQSVNPGYSNRYPIVKINNQVINSSLIDGSEDSWMKIQTATILKGSYNVKIEFEPTSTFWSLYADEIEFWCQ